MRLHNIIPLTSSGFILLLASASLLCWTYTCSYDHVLRVFGLVTASLPIASILLVRMGAIIVRHRLRRTSGSVWPILHCGSRPPTDGLPSSLPFIDIAVRWLQPPTNEIGIFTRRGIFDGIKKQFTVSDPLHLASFTFFNNVQDVEVEIWPAESYPTDQWIPPVDPSAGEEWSAKGKPPRDL